MSYQVLARRWRPKTFSELVGQEHVVRALGNALDNDRLHHAYLFTGTRGVGKTTIARILAKSLNCETGVGSSPCGECSICREVDEGRFVDLIEVDAASKTGVDDTRELLENVPYMPVRGRYKVYLIDEVHMFSSSSFNALLKTLEEPPPHVKFLLATTDPQKVPVTVLSRCLQFSLNRLPIDQIQGQFEHVLAAEQIEAQAQALYLLARAADGSMRDGLSLLDQAIAFGGGSVQTDEVRSMLGVVASDQLPGLLLTLHQGDASGMLQQVAELAQQAPDFSALLKDLLSLLHRISLLQAAPDLWQDSWGEKAPVEALQQALTPEDTQLYYQIALVGQRDLAFAPDARSGFEMILLRMLAFRPDDVGETGAAPASSPRAVERSAKTELAPSTPAVSSSASAPAQARSPSAESPAAAARALLSQQAEGGVKKTRKPTTADVPASPVSADPIATPAGSAAAPDFSDWHSVLPRLELKGLASQLANHCVVLSQQGNVLSLSVGPAAATLIGSKAQENLQAALDAYAGTVIRLEMQLGASEAGDTPAQRAEADRQQRQQQAETNIAADPLVQGLQDSFGAELVENSIRPTES